MFIKFFCIVIFLTLTVLTFCGCSSKDISLTKSLMDIDNKEKKDTADKTIIDADIIAKEDTANEIIEPSPYSNTADNETKTLLHNAITDFAEQNKFNGSVYISLDDNIMLEESYGMEDFDRAIPVTSQTKFLLASITKQFTALAIMQLQEKDLLSIDDPITKYFEGYSNWSDITIYHLLNHTSGLTDNVDFIFDVTKRDKSMFDSIKDDPLLFEPGSDFRYCNVGYNLLAFVIEEVSGESYDDYLKEFIFDPLEMYNTGCAMTSSSMDLCAKGYVNNNGVLVSQPIPDLFKLVGCCNMYSTTEDMAKWGNALYSDVLVNKETLDMIFTSGLGDYANGWFITETNGRITALHGGGCDGINTRIVKYMDENSVIVILGNVSNCDYNVVLQELDRIMFE